MSHAFWFDAALRCLACGFEAGGRTTQLHTSGLNPEPGDEWVVPGQLLPVDLGDFDDAYLTLQHPGAEADLRALEQWTCPSCHQVQWARLDFHREDPEHYRFVSARAVPLTPDTLDDMHFVSRWMDLWVQANPGPETDRILPLIRHLLP